MISSGVNIDIGMPAGPKIGLCGAFDAARVDAV
jgi:hypothetical protein